MYDACPNCRWVDETRCRDYWCNKRLRVIRRNDLFFNCDYYEDKENNNAEAMRDRKA